MTEYQGYWVYVVELDESSLAERDARSGGKAVLDVGSTGLEPEERLARHQAAGRTSARVFRRMTDPRASRLRPDLCIYAGPYGSAAEARRNERRMHNRLVADGYTVHGDKGRGMRFGRR